MKHLLRFLTGLGVVTLPILGLFYFPQIMILSLLTITIVAGLYVIGFAILDRESNP